MERRGGTRSKGRSDAERGSELQNLVASRRCRGTAVTGALRGHVPERDGGLAGRRDSGEERVSDVAETCEAPVN